MKSWRLGLLAAGMLAACTSMPRSSDTTDPQSSAVEVAMSIGQVQALAGICAAPAWSYRTQLANATSAMPSIYANAKLEPTEAAQDIVAGERAETSRRDDPSWPLDCNRFRHQVSYVTARVAQASGRVAPPLAPVDRSDWRSHPPIAVGMAMQPPAPSAPVTAIVPDPEETMPENSGRTDDSYRRDIP